MKNMTRFVLIQGFPHMKNKIALKQKLIKSSQKHV